MKHILLFLGNLLKKKIPSYGVRNKIRMFVIRIYLRVVSHVAMGVKEIQISLWNTKVTLENILKESGRNSNYVEKQNDNTKQEPERK